MQVKFQLNHSSNFPGCVGQPGEVVVCERSVADEMISRNGGKIIEIIPPDPKGKQHVKPSARRN